MRIPRFYDTFLKHVTKSVTKVGGPTVGVSFNINRMVHDVVRTMPGSGVTSHVQYVKGKLIELLKYHVINLKPTHYVLLCLDGRVPYAKIHRQRSRRFMDKPPPKFRNCEGFNPHVITAGTEFMAGISQAVFDFGETLKQEHVLFSGSQTPGEGEQKIMAELRDLKPHLPEGNHIIVGDDGEFSMPLLLLSIPGIFILRQEGRYSSKYISIDSLREYLNAVMPGNQSIENFVILTFMMGNDFLPPVRSLSSFDNYYTEIFPRARGEIVNDEGLIDGKAMVEALTSLSDKEVSMFEEQAEMVYTNEYKNLMDYVVQGKHEPNQLYTSVEKFDYDKFRDNWYSQMIPGGVNLIVGRYLRMMQWTMDYYSGKNVSWEVAYIYPAAPLMKDIVEYLTVNVFPGAPEPVDRLDLVMNLCMVMPHHSKHLIPLPWRDLLGAGSFLFDLMPIEFKTREDGKNYYRIPLLYPPDPTRVVCAVKSLKTTLPDSLEDKEPVRTTTRLLVPHPS